MRHEKQLFTKQTAHLAKIWLGHTDFVEALHGDAFNDQAMQIEGLARELAVLRKVGLRNSKAQSELILNKQK